ncbi:nuclear transport factor 2 family protein [Pseudoalteromonas sp. B137]
MACSTQPIQSETSSNKMINQGSNRMTNLEIIKSTYEGSSSEENGRNLQKHIADDIKWKEADGFPLSGTYIGFKEIEQKVFSQLATQWTDYRFIVDGYVADGDHVFAYGTYHGVFNKTGKVFSARVAHLWTLKNHKIISFEQFVDSVP